MQAPHLVHLHCIGLVFGGIRYTHPFFGTHFPEHHAVDVVEFSGSLMQVGSMDASIKIHPYIGMRMNAGSLQMKITESTLRRLVTAGQEWKDTLAWQVSPDVVVNADPTLIIQVYHECLSVYLTLLLTHTIYSDDAHDTQPFVVSTVQRFNHLGV